jgi:hypothetical protein
MAERIGRADYEVRADASQLPKDLSAAEQKVKQSGANVEKSAMATGAAFKAASAVAALGFGVMAKGALEMERAQGNFQAATGASREEAVAFSKDMNGIVGTAQTVGASFSQITSAGTAVAQQFKLTGAEGTALTQDFLGFAKVTGQDATGAVNDFDAALDAFGEPAERATGLMDQLVASNQEYGTDAGPAAVGALQKMAPALTAMGLGLDEGIGLLNMFEDAGIDASKAPAALTKAIAELEPGQNINDLIAQIGAIEDPLERASAAAEIFGVKNGAALANAIKPGMTSLDEYMLTVEETAGTAEKAAEDMVTTGDRIRMFAEKAGAALRGLGQEMGPLLSGAGGLVTALGALPSKVTQPLVDGLKGVWGKVAGSTVVKTAAGLAGAAAGAAYSGAMFVGEKISGAAASMLGGLKSNPAVTRAGDAAGKAMGGVVGKALMIGAAIALIAMIPELWDKMQAEWNKVTANRELIETNKNAFLATFPTRAEVETQLAVLKDVPNNLHGAAGGLFNIDAFGVQTEWRNTIAAFEAYLASGMADTARAGHESFVAEWAKGEFIGPLSESQLAELKAAGVRDGRLIGTESQNAFAAAWLAGEVMGPLSPDQIAMLEAAGVSSGHDIGAATGSEFATSTQDAINEQIQRQNWLAMAPETQMLAHARELGGDVSVQIAAGMTAAEASTALKGAVDGLNRILETEMSAKEQAQFAMGKDLIKAVNQGMKSESPETVDVARGVAIDAIDAIENAGLDSGDGMKRVGVLYDRLLASGLTQEEARVALAAGGVAGAVIDKLEGIAPKAETAAEDAADEIPPPFQDAVPKVGRSVDRINGEIDRIDTDIDVTIGFKVDRRGLTGIKGELRQHGGPVRKDEFYIVGEQRPELFVPDRPGYVYPSVPRFTEEEPWTPPAPAPARAPLQVNLIGTHIYDDQSIYKLGQELDRVYRHFER